jgi:N-acetylglucosaminyl-diphospho-decaprenol L-rhamnosyltransferase
MGPAAPVTVAVVSWNTRALLSECLESLHDDAQAGLADVWVFDNASGDGSVDLVRDTFPWATLVASSENLGFGAAVNRVAAETGGSWLVAANADTRVTTGCLRMLLEEGERQPGAGVLAPRLTLPDGTTQHSVYPFPTIPFTLAYVSGATAANRRLAHHWCIDDGFDPGEARAVPWAVGAFLLVRRTAWEQVGGFDEAQWMYAEDLDLGWRMSRAGWKAIYVPGAEVFHAESAATSQAWGGSRHARWHAATYAWILRRRGLVRARCLAAINVLGFLGRAALLAPVALAGSGRARAAFGGALGASRAHTVGFRSRQHLERSGSGGGP